MEPKFILIVINSAKFLLSHRWPLVEAAQKAGYRVEIVCPESVFCSVLKERGITIHFVPFARKEFNPVHEIFTFLSLMGVYMKLRPDIVHHVSLKPIIYGGFLSKILRLKFTVNAVTGLGHTFTSDTVKNKIIRYFVKSVFSYFLNTKNSHFIFQNCDDQMELFQRGGPHSGSLIPGAGVDTKVFIPSQRNSPFVVIAFAGRMLVPKGVLQFVEVAKHFAKEKAWLKFVLIGDEDLGNPESLCRAQLADWNKEGIIEWWGESTCMEKTLCDIDLLVFPSIYREGVPKILIETAAVGRPIITTDTPGCRDIVIDGYNGVLVSPNDQKALIKSVKLLSHSKTLRTQYGRNGRTLVIQGFDVETVVSKTLEIYASSMAKV